MQYAVRGKLVIRAGELDAQLKGGDKSLPFNEIIYCNIGNPQQLNQKPISFVRQVLAGVEYPPLLDSAVAGNVLPADAVARAKEIVNAAAPSTGAYSNSKGHAFVRQHIADFIAKRDGHPADPEHIFITDGASPGVKMSLNMLIRSKKDGIMIPIPQYPLYSATIELLGGKQVDYYLEEEKEWALSVDELDRQYEAAVADGIDVRALAVINPGNPTGQVMSYENIAEVAKWAERRDVVLLADEVYQVNVYDSDKQFHSFKKVVSDLGLKVPLFSFHSVSKGVLGECGKRGGYMELCNFDKSLVDTVYKFASVSLCPNIAGQLTVDLMVKPPAEGDASFESYTSEVNELFTSLQKRAALVAEMLNSLEGVTCNPPQGAMYAFPQITLSAKVVAAAEAAGMAPDAFYATELLESTGICVVPGSGFGQREGTYHYRTTFLPAAEKMELVTKLMTKFHAEFMDKYR